MHSRKLKMSRLTLKVSAQKLIKNLQKFTKIYKKNLGASGSAALKFIGYKKKPTNTQTSKVYMYI